MDNLQPTVVDATLNEVITALLYDAETWGGIHEWGHNL